MIFPEVIFNINHSENGKWIEDLRLLKHIKSLHLYVLINDLSFLEEFVNLKELYVENSTETNWSFLEKMNNLKYLWVYNCSFSDITPLAVLNKEQMKACDKKKLEDNEKLLICFNRIENLHLIHCNISDISPLSECKKLSDVDLSFNNISDISPLSSIASLYYLTMRYNNITDITPLKGHGRLYYLNLRHNHISDISVLKEFENSNLSRLFMEYNNIEDYSPVCNINLIADDIFIGKGDDKIVRTNLVKRMPENFLGGMKFNDELSKVVDQNIKNTMTRFENIALYYGTEEWLRWKRIYFLLGHDNSVNNKDKDFQDYIHTSSVRKVCLENNNTTIRFITSNSEYFFTGDPEKIMDYYNRNFT